MKPGHPITRQRTPRLLAGLLIGGLLASVGLFVTSPAVPAAELANVLKAQAEQGDARAQFKLGSLYDSGNGVTRNYEAAATWYRKAADHGVAFAQSNLGVMYALGQGVPQNDEEAYFWMLLGATSGDNHLGTFPNLVAGHLAPQTLAAVQARVHAWKPTLARRTD